MSVVRMSTGYSTRCSAVCRELDAGLGRLEGRGLLGVHGAHVDDAAALLAVQTAGNEMVSAEDRLKDTVLGLHGCCYGHSMATLKCSTLLSLPRAVIGPHSGAIGSRFTVWWEASFGPELKRRISHRLTWTRPLPAFAPHSSSYGTPGSSGHCLRVTARFQLRNWSPSLLMR